MCRRRRRRRLYRPDAHTHIRLFFSAGGTISYANARTECDMKPKTLNRLIMSIIIQWKVLATYMMYVFPSEMARKMMLTRARALVER